MFTARLPENIEQWQQCNGQRVRENHITRSVLVMFYDLGLLWMICMDTEKSPIVHMFRVKQQIGLCLYWLLKCGNQIGRIWLHRFALRLSFKVECEKVRQKKNYCDEPLSK